MERSSVRTLDRITEGSNKEIDKGIDKEMDKEMDKEIDKGIDKEIGKGIGKDITKSDLVPKYTRDLTACPNVIMHIGVGGFHRSHQALFKGGREGGGGGRGGDRER